MKEPTQGVNVLNQSKHNHEGTQQPAHLTVWHATCGMHDGCVLCPTVAMGRLEDEKHAFASRAAEISSFVSAHRVLVSAQVCFAKVVVACCLQANYDLQYVLQLGV